MKILKAYCQELGEMVDIHELYAASIQQNGKRFSLYCSYDECLRNGVEIIGVNYHRPKSEQRNAMYFRENERFSHSNSCPWKIFSKNVAAKDRYADESEEEYLLRQKCHCDLDDWITRYAPRVEGGVMMWTCFAVMDFHKISTTSKVRSMMSR